MRLVWYLFREQFATNLTSDIIFCYFLCLSNTVITDIDCKIRYDVDVDNSIKLFDINASFAGSEILFLRSIYSTVATIISSLNSRKSIFEIWIFQRLTNWPLYWHLFYLHDRSFVNPSLHNSLSPAPVLLFLISMNPKLNDNFLKYFSAI